MKGDRVSGSPKRPAGMRQDMGEIPHPLGDTMTSSKSQHGHSPDTTPYLPVHPPTTTVSSGDEQSSSPRAFLY